MEYNFNKIEAEWRDEWEKNKTFAASNTSTKPKYYVLDMFPYPSGAGLHVGHPLGYIASDIMARYKRHQGFNVLHPMGFDAFGLPAEQYAIQTGRHPADTTEENINRYIEQLKNIGFAYDWDRQVNTSDPSYYRWTQWIFVKLFNHWYDTAQQKARPIEELEQHFSNNGSLGIAGFHDVHADFSADDWNGFSPKEKSSILMRYRLAYQDYAWVNWCEALGTVLANDEVKDGVSERGGHPVERKQLAQWFLRITAYGERLLNDLNTLDWSDSMKEMQRHWIGKSEGARIQFRVVDPSQTLAGGEDFDSGKQKKPRWNTADESVYPILREFQIKLRANPTDAEEIVWQWLRRNSLNSHFRRQHIIDKYIVDFVSIRHKLVIEIDGRIHDYTQEADAIRTARLNELGFKVIRFTNDTVFDENNTILAEVSEHIKKAVADQVPSPGGDLGEVRSFEVFTTRPDTIFGVTFMVLAPESELAITLTTEEQKAEVDAYIQKAKNRSERERQADVKTVSGVFTGSYAVHPFTNEAIPIWIGDYVLAGYGTGAVMAVPAHDERDFRFAKHFGLPIPQVIKPADGEISEELTEPFSAKEGVCVNSDFLNGLPVKEAITRAIDEAENLGIGTREVNFRLRDANFSRQRYWGEPFPVIHKADGSVETLKENELPLELPKMADFKPTGRPESPLAKLTEWVNLGNGDIRETDTMPGFAGSSWYFLRYMDPNNHEAFADKKALDYWRDVDLYIGGTEHAVGHLLYSRFWHKFLYDLGFVPTVEPFKKLVNQGMIQGTTRKIKRLIFVERGSFSEKSDLKTPEYIFFKGEKFELKNHTNLSNPTIFISNDYVEKYLEETENLFISNLQLSPGYTQAIVPIQAVNYNTIDDKHYINLEIFRKWEILNEEEKNALYITQNGIYNSKGEIIIEQNNSSLFAVNENEELDKSIKFTLSAEIDKMSKSKFNVINPDELCKNYGADTLRMYEMFLGPVEQSKPWNTNGIEGVHRFLKRFWNLFHPGGNFNLSEEPADKKELKILHTCIKKVSADMEQFGFNTCVSHFMICCNELTELKSNKRAVLETVLTLLSPFAPHIAEELWKKCGHAESISIQPWPQYNEAFLVEDNFNYPVSFNGKMRFQIELPITMDAKTVEATVMADERAQKWLEGNTPKKVIVVPKKIVNIVI